MNGETSRKEKMTDPNWDLYLNLKKSEEILKVRQPMTNKKLSERRCMAILSSMRKTNPAYYGARDETILKDKTTWKTEEKKKMRKVK